jgi:hypothetical protein
MLVIFSEFIDKHLIHTYIRMKPHTEISIFIYINIFMYSYRLFKIYWRTSYTYIYTHKDTHRNQFFIHINIFIYSYRPQALSVKQEEMLVIFSGFIDKHLLPSSHEKRSVALKLAIELVSMYIYMYIYIYIYILIYVYVFIVFFIYFFIFFVVYLELRIKLVYIHVYAHFYITFTMCEWWITKKPHYMHVFYICIYSWPDILSVYIYTVIITYVNDE